MLIANEAGDHGGAAVERPPRLRRSPVRPQRQVGAASSGAVAS